MSPCLNFLTVKLYLSCRTFVKISDEENELGRKHLFSSEGDDTILVWNFLDLHSQI